MYVCMYVCMCVDGKVMWAAAETGDHVVYVLGDSKKAGAGEGREAEALR